MKIFSIFLASFLLAAPLFAADLNYEVSAAKLDKSRNNLSPTTGGSAFSFEPQDIENLPQGQMTSLNQVLLRAPGVVQDSYGQIHVRGDHSALQYRLNGIIIPEGISGFGQSFDTNFVESVDLLTGALPAQFGYRSAGVVDIKTKKGTLNKAGRSTVMVGGNNTVGLNQQISGSQGRLSYYLNAGYLQNSRGIESPTSAKNSIHNNSKQDKFFGYFSYLLDASQRLTFMLGNSTGRFQIPNNPNADQSGNYTLNGFGNSFNINNLNENQKEASTYAVAALQGISSSDVDYQISAFTRYSTLNFQSDYVGDLIINGVASNINRQSLMNGLQGDMSYDVNEKNKLRYGFYFTTETFKNRSANFLFPTDINGDQAANDPSRVNDSHSKSAQFYSLYVQDEFKPIEKLTLNFGARFDKSAAYLNEQQISPRFGAVYEMSKKTKLHAGFSRYFTPPPLAQIANPNLNNFADTTNAPENFNNGKARAERSSYYDLGIAQKFTPHLTIGLDGYYKSVRNLLDSGQFGNAPIYSSFNYQKGEIYGIELSGDYKKDNFSAFFNFAAQNARAKNAVSSQYLLENGEISYLQNHYAHLDHLQKYTASAGVAYKYHQVNYAADMLYGSGLRTGDNNLNSMPAYTQFNASIARDVNMFLLNKINLRLSLLNLFDSTYKLHDGSGIGVAATQYGPRRTLYLTISKQF